MYMRAPIFAERNAVCVLLFFLNEEDDDFDAQIVSALNTVFKHCLAVSSG
jgi:hypothetical protein